jgi:predicted aminopeptidase
MGALAENAVGRRWLRQVSVTRLRWLAVVTLGAALSGCEATGYYGQAIAGHLELLNARQSVEVARQIAEDGGNKRLVQQLTLAMRIRAFASDRLGLPDNGSYRHYADLQRPFVVWNVFAAPALSLQPKQWCFPVAGCVTYRGYYDRAEAYRHAALLRAEGWDTLVAGVPAYSTLGFFDDPLLNTFIYRPEGELARLIFHELAHQVVYVQDDTAFNESFASAVEQAGVSLWLSEHGSPQARVAYGQALERREQFRRLVFAARAELETIYGDDALTVATKRQRKHALLSTLASRYSAMRSQWGATATVHDHWFNQPLSNAHLAAVVSYETWVPAFQTLLARHHGDFPAFFEEVRRLTRLDRAARIGTLQQLAAQR